MLEVVYRVITWGLLASFAGFFAYGVIIALYNLFCFYRTEFTKLVSGMATRSSK